MRWLSVKLATHLFRARTLRHRRNYRLTTTILGNWESSHVTWSNRSESWWTICIRAGGKVTQVLRWKISDGPSIRRRRAFLTYQTVMTWPFADYTIHWETFTEESRDRSTQIFGEGLHSQDRSNRRKTRKEMVPASLSRCKTGQSHNKDWHRIWRLCEVWRNLPQWCRSSRTETAERFEWCFASIQTIPCCTHLWHRWDVFENWSCT